MPELKISCTITPPPAQISTQELDNMLDGELVEFERYFMRVQRERGGLEPSPLLTGEKSIIKAYVMYLASKEPV